MRKLESKYDRELVIVGVEAGKFLAERSTQNIRQAVLRLELDHPVVNDRHFRIWRSYAVSAWPTTALVDPAGYLLGARPGELSFEELDPLIGELVREYETRGLLDRRTLDFLRPERLSEPQRPLAFPGKLLAKSDRLYIADSNHNRILVVTLESGGKKGRVTDIVGRGDAGLVDGGFTAAAFHHPQGLALDGDLLYVADAENHAIRAIDLRRGMVTTVAGTGEQARATQGGGRARAVALSSPWDLAVHEGMLYIAMAGTHQIWRFDPSSDHVAPYAGSGHEALVDGSLAGSALAQPMGITSSGRHLYFADSESSAVREADLPPGDQVDTVVGSGLFDYGDRDGAGEAARLQHAQGIACHGDRLFVADSYNNKIKIVDPGTRVANTFLGDGSTGHRDGDRPCFYEPAGVSAAGDRLYIADTNNHAIRVADLQTGVVLTLDITF